MFSGQFGGVAVEQVVRTLFAPPGSRTVNSVSERDTKVRALEDEAHPRDRRDADAKQHPPVARAALLDHSNDCHVDSPYGGRHAEATAATLAGHHARSRAGPLVAQGTVLGRACVWSREPQASAQEGRRVRALDVDQQPRCRRQRRGVARSNGGHFFCVERYFEDLWLPHASFTCGCSLARAQS